MPIKMRGKRFGRLLVIEYAGDDTRSNKYWKCKCDCGSFVTIRGDCLRSGNTKSCGCLVFDKPLKHGATVNGERQVEYNIWAGIRNRCLNPNSKDYCRYGGRGIDIDPRWHDFSIFISDVGRRPSSNHTIERIDNSRGYWPDNVRWATLKEQAQNRRTNVYLEYGGTRRTVSEWAEVLGIGESTLRERIKRGYSVENVLLSPVHKKNDSDERFLTANGETLSLSQWCRRLDCSRNAIISRLSRGWTEQRALSTPIKPRRRK